MEFEGTNSLRPNKRHRGQTAALLKHFDRQAHPGLEQKGGGALGGLPLESKAIAGKGPEGDPAVPKQRLR